ncbi:response regulator [Dechloromonas sp. ZS-1]|uniref:response regulator transcription factor n=1 Tax=Dechloromonas sp. ZS-1 TaxID=3138067 RepID=UPI0031FCC3EB
MNNPGKILVVEDRPEIRLLVAMAVKPFGHTLIEADSGKAGLAAIHLHRPDLILLDVMMPGEINGFGICRIVKQDPELRDTPVVMMTALAQASDIEEGMAAGADDYIVKPFSLVALRSIIGRLLGRSGEEAGRP